MDKHQILQNLANQAIVRLKNLTQPVVRASGPITSGGFGYEENLKRFIRAQEVLREKGLTVFDYFEGHNDEEEIKSLDLPWEEVMEHYHRPILESGLIKESFFLPGWQDSNGATWEHRYATEAGIEIKYFKEEWFYE